MFLEETPERLDPRHQLRGHDSPLTPEVRTEPAGTDWGPRGWRTVVRTPVPTAGRAAAGHPRTVSLGRRATDPSHFLNETRRAGGAFPLVTVDTVGPTLLPLGGVTEVRGPTVAMAGGVVRRAAP